MDYCARCVYPANAKPAIILDEKGVCSGCRYHESRSSADWPAREKMLRELLEMYRRKASEQKLPYDCIIPVSGGKDSLFQTHLLKTVYGMNPLLVTYNHSFNTPLGIRNLNNLVASLGCDLVRFTTNPQSAQRIAKYMLRKVGDITWHYHAGIRTFPLQVAAQYGIPLVVWGEHGFAELTGMFTLEDMVEFTKWSRREHDMRGYEPEDLLTEDSGILPADLGPYRYPSDERIDEIGVRGIYLSNFIDWDAKKQAELMIQKYGFSLHPGPRDRTFVLYGKTEDHANDVHDYLKYLKFGYGRSTDDASTEVRHGRMTREEAIDLVEHYDHARPTTLDSYLRYLAVSEEEFETSIESMRDLSIWTKDHAGRWVVTDSVSQHRDDAQVEDARVPLVAAEERTFGSKNRGLYQVAGRVVNHSDDSRQSTGYPTDFVVL